MAIQADPQLLCGKTSPRLVADRHRRAARFGSRPATGRVLRVGGKGNGSGRSRDPLQCGAALDLRPSVWANRFRLQRKQPGVPRKDAWKENRGVLGGGLAPLPTARGSGWQAKNNRRRRRGVPASDSRAGRFDACGRLRAQEELSRSENVALARVEESVFSFSEFLVRGIHRRALHADGVVHDGRPHPLRARPVPRSPVRRVQSRAQLPGRSVLGRRSVPGILAVYRHALPALSVPGGHRPRLGASARGVSDRLGRDPSRRRARLPVRRHVPAFAVRRIHFDRGLGYRVVHRGNLPARIDQRLRSSLQRGIFLACDRRLEKLPQNENRPRGQPDPLSGGNSPRAAQVESARRRRRTGNGFRRLRGDRSGADRSTRLDSQVRGEDSG